MANDIIGTPVDDYVALQINKRQSDHGSGVIGSKSLDQLRVLNSNTSWVKLVSGAEVTDSKRIPVGEPTGLALAKKYILFGGVKDLQTGFPKEYQIGGQTNVYGYLPPPGIENIKVSYLNRGSVRKAEIKIKVYGKEQFQVIDALYLRLGYYVLLEWGHSLYSENSGGVKSMGSTVCDDKFFNYGSTTTVLQVSKDIESYRRKYSGNYDGMFGRVTNFSFTRDGESYDVSLTITSTGDIVESLKINIPPNRKEIETIKNISLALTETPASDKITALESSNDSSPTKDKLSAYLFIQKLFFRQIYTTDPTDITYEAQGIFGNEKIEIGNFVKPTSKISISSATTESPNEIELKEMKEKKANGETRWTPKTTGAVKDIDEAIKEKELAIANEKKTGPKDSFTLSGISTISQKQDDVVYFFYSNGSDYESNIPEDLGFYMRLGHLLEYIQKNVIPKVETTKQPIINLDYDENTNFMYHAPGQISLDPRVCVVNGVIYKNIICFPQLRTWGDSSIGVAKIMNIYVSFKEIQKLLGDGKEEINLYKFLDGLCKSLNVALGGVNNLEPVLDEFDNTMRIIDSSYQFYQSPKVNYGLSLYGYKENNNISTFVKNIKTKTKIPPEMKSVVQVASTSNKYTTGVEGSMFARLNKGIEDLYALKFTDPDPSTQINGNGKDGAVQNYVKNFYGTSKLALGYKYNSSGLSQESPELDDSAINNNITIVTEFYKYLQFRLSETYKNKNYASPTQGLIPFDLGITIDGLSGFRIYNRLLFDTSFFPTSYSTAMRFLLSNISHNVSNQTWETTLETVMTSETFEKGAPIVRFNDVDLLYRKILVDGGINEVESQLDFLLPIYSPPVLAAPGGGSLSNTAGVQAEGGWEVFNGGKQITDGLDLSKHWHYEKWEDDPQNKRSGGWSKDGSGRYMYDLVLWRKENGVKTQRPFVPSPVNGKVTGVGLFNDKSASYIYIQALDGSGTYVLLHCDNEAVRVGDTVKRGQLIARQSDVMYNPDIAKNVHLHIQFPSKQVLISYIKSLVENSF
jgi:hypothetical protein